MAKPSQGEEVRISEPHFAAVAQVAEKSLDAPRPISEDSFVCVDMACDVWDMVKTRGLDAKIMAGNVRKDISSLAEANHTWVMVEVSPGDWVAIEATGGRVVERAENSRYYRGRSFSSPKELKDFYYGRGTLARS